MSAQINQQLEINSEAAECALLGLLDIIPDTPTEAEMQAVYKTATGLSMLHRFGLEKRHESANN